jgi:hypothetical protein
MSSCVCGLLKSTTGRPPTPWSASRTVSVYVVILSNDVRSEAGFAELVRLVLGDTGVPYDWEYGATQESNELALSVAGKPCRQPAVAPTRQARTSRGASAYQLARSG